VPTRRLTVNSAVLLAMLLLLGSGGLFAQQRPYPKADLTPLQVDSLRSAIQEVGNRAIIGFKPAYADRGMLDDGRAAMDQPEVRIMAESLRPMGVMIIKQFEIIPAAVVTIDPSRLGDLLAHPNIEYVQPDRLYELIQPVDPEVVDSISSVTDTVQTVPWGIRRTRSDSAWTVTKGAGAKVGIIDTGIDYHHPDLNVIAGFNAITDKTEQDDWSDNSPTCGFKHGTHVAGSVAALDNDFGVVGVAPESELYAIRVFDPENAGIGGCYARAADIVNAIQWSTTNEMDVINLSLGSCCPNGAERDAMVASYAAGVVIVLAAGNSSSTVGFPAGFSQGVAVSATDSLDVLAGFSNYGPEIEVTGPGVSVLSTYGPSSYVRAGGTSMASPHAAGVATLIRAASPNLSAPDVREILRNTADDIGSGGYDQNYGWGMVDSYEAVKSVDTASFALAASPGRIFLHAEPAGSPVNDSLKIQLLGKTGSITWHASADSSWLTLSADSGTVSDSVPVFIGFSADPSGRPAGIYNDFITITGNAENSPITPRVRFSVTPKIVVSDTTEIKSELRSTDTPLRPAYGGEAKLVERVRFLLKDTGAEQKLDIVVLSDTTHDAPLFNPVIRIVKPDGEDISDLVFHGAWFGLGNQPMLHGITIPAGEGDHYIEVASGSDQYSGKGFVVKVREHAPILSVQGYSPSAANAIRSKEHGPTQEQKINVISVCSDNCEPITFTVSTSTPWLSVSPGSGSISVSESSVSFPPNWGDLSDESNKQGQSQANDTWLRDQNSEMLLNSGIEADVTGPELTIQANPIGLSEGWHSGSVFITDSGGWLPPFRYPIKLLVYSKVVDIVAESSDDRLLGPWEIATDNDPTLGARGIIADYVKGVVSVELQGDGIHEVNEDTPVDLSGLYGLASKSVSEMYMGTDANEVHTANLLTGVTEKLADIPALPYFMGKSLTGGLYATTCTGDAYKVQADGAVESFGSGISGRCLGDVVHNPADNNVYIARPFDGSGISVLKEDGEAVGEVANRIPQPMSLTVASDGTIFVGTMSGELWKYSPNSGPSEGQFLAYSPSIDWSGRGGYMSGVTIADDWLLISASNSVGAGSGQGEIYRYPLDGIGPREGIIIINMEVDSIVNLLPVSLAKTVPGEPFRISLDLSIGSALAADSPLGSYTVQLKWWEGFVDLLDGLNSISPGTFHTAPSSLTTDLCDYWNSSCEYNVQLTGTESEGRSSGSFSLVNLEMRVNEHISSLPLEDQPEILPIDISTLEVLNLENTSLMPKVIVVPSGICFGKNYIGDVTLDSQISPADVTQILRKTLNLSAASGVDLDMGDTTGDGNIGIGDAIDVLRNTVGLPTGGSRVGKPPIEKCD